MSSVAKRANQRFNIENRAQRIIAQDKPRPAPKYEADARELERILKGENKLILNKFLKYFLYRSSRVC